ncbi:MAG: EamA family transporter, partial [Alphaproteobacteria bacterium]
VGLAFFCWDYGVKHGHIQALGSSSYAAPLLSTLVLVLFGFASATGAIIIACLLITTGAIFASIDLLRPGRI